MKQKLNRNIYLFETGMVKLRKGANFQKLFHRWYMSDSDIVPNRIYDFLKREGIINNFYRKV